MQIRKDDEVVPVGDDPGHQVGRVVDVVRAGVEVLWSSSGKPFGYHHSLLRVVRRVARIGDVIKMSNDYLHERVVTEHCLTAKWAADANSVGWTHEDGIPFAYPSEYKSRAEHREHLVRIGGPKIQGDPINIANCIRDAFNHILRERQHSFTRAELARRLFASDARTKRAMSLLEKPQVDKAYARGVFGYQPETEWAAAAWALATELTS